MTKKELLWELCSDLILKSNGQNPSLLSYFKNYTLIFDYNTEKGRLWCSVRKIWNILHDEYDLTYDEVQVFIKNEVEEHFKCEGVTISKLWN